jgi:hypothetical protein
MIDRILEALIRALREAENSVQDPLESSAVQIERLNASIKRGLNRIDAAARFWLTCLATALLLLVVALAVPAVRDVGSGYFLRAAILLAGISVGMLLDPQRTA